MCKILNGRVQQLKWGWKKETAVYPFNLVLHGSKVALYDEEERLGRTATAELRPNSLCALATALARHATHFVKYQSAWISGEIVNQF